MLSFQVLGELVFYEIAQVVTAAHCVEGQAADSISVNIILSSSFSHHFVLKDCIFGGGFYVCCLLLCSAFNSDDDQIEDKQKLLFGYKLVNQLYNYGNVARQTFHHTLMNDV